MKWLLGSLRKVAGRLALWLRLSKRRDAIEEAERKYYEQLYEDAIRNMRKQYDKDDI